MPFTGNENHYISLHDAAELTANFRNSHPIDTTIALFYGKSTIQSILNQPNCVGIRIYYAQEANNESTMVIVGTDVYGNDIENGILAEHGIKCPSSCSNSNLLNS
jgi:hypothetical protein